MGGGVAIGDFNNDDLPDIYVTGNQVENKLYLNQGDMEFDDVTASAGVGGDHRWYTGVTLVDINYDGWLDIYLSVSGSTRATKNQLFLNNGDMTFVEKASDYGIDDASNSIQSTFFDYDKDGDLDLFVANYPLVPLTQGNLFYAGMMKKNRPEHSGHLYRNDNNNFTDVTEAAGVRNFGLTLGLSSADFNDDGWADLYLSNDFNVPDYFYLNNGDGTFTEALKSATRHTSMFGMGIDVADFTNDGLLDLVQVDMTPENYYRARINMASMSAKTFWEAVDLGFHYQYMQNSLQINQGMNAESVPVLSEISRLAGVATTDWSWSALFMDMDNDGWKDLYITNGMKRDINDNDRNRRTGATSFAAVTKAIDISEYPSVPLENYALQNRRDYTFAPVTADWGLADESFSNGMSYGDLDNDGDLDLVINNIDSELGLYENHAHQRVNDFLRVKLIGSARNPLGIGAKVYLKDEKDKTFQVQEQLLTRGFQSSVDPVIFFGLGKGPSSKTLLVQWPDFKVEEINVVSFNQVIELNHANAIDPVSDEEKKRQPQFIDFTDSTKLNFEHHEDLYDDYIYEPLLPYKYSTLGPGMAVGDVNNDGLDDIYLGNASKSISGLLVQDSRGGFIRQPGPWERDEDQEDTGALFFDADGDEDLDLYVTSGGHNPNEPPAYYQDRLYINTTEGYQKTQNALPPMAIPGKVVAAADFGHDGKLDLFVGGRNVPGRYPETPNSFLLKNKGGQDLQVEFQDVTAELGERLQQIGMVTSAIWSDLDGDSWEELIIVGEWMPITIFKNNQGLLVDVTEDWGFKQNTGWWYCVTAFDVDNDGDTDLVAGNLGLNYKYTASQEKPFEVFASDFDQNGRMDIVFGMHKEGKLLPLRGRECSSQQVQGIENKFPTYREFASADLAGIYGAQMIEAALHLEATTFAHYWIENRGGGAFEWHQLPQEAQIAPVNSIIPFDYDRDGFLDLLVAGGLYDAEVETPRADASVGSVLRNLEGKGFKAIAPSATGLMTTGDVRVVRPIMIREKSGFVFGLNSGRPQVVLIWP